jgi:hypothetical protein
MKVLWGSATITALLLGTIGMAQTVLMPTGILEAMPECAVSLVLEPTTNCRGNGIDALLIFWYSLSADAWRPQSSLKTVP